MRLGPLLSRMRLLRFDAVRGRGGSSSLVNVARPSFEAWLAHGRGEVRQVWSTARARLNEAKAGGFAVSSWFGFYSDLLATYPLRANAFVSGSLCAIGDVVAQGIEMKLDVGESKSWSPLRTARMATYGTLVCGPLLYGWYSTLHFVGEAIKVSHVPLVGSRMSAMLPWLGSVHTEVANGLSPARLLVAKVVADGLFFQAPFLNLYFATMGLLEGRGPTEIYEKTKAAFHRAWALSLLVWTPVQLLNLSLVPPPLQPAVVSAVNVGWKATLSLLNAMQQSSGHQSTLRRRNTVQIEQLEEENRVLRHELSEMRETLLVLWEESETGIRPVGTRRFDTTLSFS